MRDDKKLNKILKEGETIRWSGAPQPYKLFDKTHTNSTMISLCWALAWGIFLVGGYYALSVYHGQEIKKGAVAFCSVIPLMLACGPTSDKSNVKKLMYAVTDKRAIVISSSDEKECAMNIAGIDDLRVEKNADGNCNVRVGSPVFKTSARKLPGLAFRGSFDMKDNNKIYNGLVFYNVSADDGQIICDLIKPSANTGQAGL